MATSRSLHLVLVAALAALVTVAAPTVPAAHAVDCTGVELGVACDVTIATVAGQEVLGTVPNNGDILLIKSINAEGSDIEPRVYVGPDTDPANAVCELGGLLDDCQLPDSGGSSTVYVRDVDDDETGDGIVYVQNLTNPEQCVAPTTPQPWGDAGTPWAAPAGGAACQVLTLAEQERLQLGASAATTAATQFRIYDATGARQCLINPFVLDCELAAGTYLLVADQVLPGLQTPGAAGSGRFHAYDRASSAGCGTSPSGFEVAPATSTLVDGEYECRTITVGDDARLLPGVSRVEFPGGDAFPIVYVVDDAGDDRCSGVNFVLASFIVGPCELDEAGTYKVLTGVAIETAGTASYDAAVANAVSPRTGCRTFDLGDTVTIESSASVRVVCLEFEADAGEEITAIPENRDGPTGGGIGAVDGAGDGACIGDFGTTLISGCELDTAGPHAIVALVPAGVSYDLVTDCESEEVCGTGEVLLDADVTPDRIGNSGTSTITLAGQNLETIQRVELLGAGGTFTSVAQDSIEAGQTASAVFELDGAMNGVYDVRIVTADGPALVEDAVTIEDTRPADLSVSIAGPAATRPGRGVPLTISVVNDGNVDALGVPLFYEVIRDAEVDFLDADIERPAEVVGLPNHYEHENGYLDFQSQAARTDVGGLADLYVSINDMPIFTDVYPLLIPFVPTGGRIDIPTRMTPPAGMNSNASASATVGECLLGDPHEIIDDLGPTQEDLDCADAIGDAFMASADLAVGLIPGGDCATSIASATSGQIRTTYDFAQMSPSQRNNYAFLGDLVFNAANTVADCVLKENPVGTVLSAAYGAFNAGYAVGTAIKKCSDGDTWVHDLAAFFGFDPNDITGPSGVGDEHFVLPSQDFGYHVRFENDPEEATAAAQQVTVSVPIDGDLDPSSIAITGFGFGDIVRTPIVGTLPFSTEIPLTAAQSPDGMGALLVTVEAELDGDTLEVVFGTFAPDGGEPGVLDGFLPPNETSPEGEGYVTYAIEGDLADTDVVTAQANIVFDTNDPIVTNTWSNTIDGRAPTTSVAAPTAPAGSPRVDLSWGGDDSSGSGVARFDVAVSTDGGGTYEPFLDDTLLTTAQYVAPRGTDVRFQVQSRDRVGLVGTTATSAPIRIPIDAIDRLAGETRVDTALEVSRASFDEALTVLLARADAYPDALAGAPLAFRLGAPLLLTDRAELSEGVVEEILRLGARNVVVLGGTVAIAPAVVDDLTGEPVNLDVRRIAGESRFDTARLVAQEVATDPLRKAYVVEGTNPDPARGWPDALAIAPVAAREGAPILLAARDVLPDDTRTALSALDPDVVDLVGGQVALSAEVEQAIRSEHPDGNRIAGENRYQTGFAAASLGAVSGATPTVTWFATGRSFPDALAACPAVAAAGDRLLLVDGVDPSRSPTVLALLEAQADAIEVVRVLGGPVAIGDATEAALRAALR